MERDCERERAFVRRFVVDKKIGIVNDDNDMEAKISNESSIWHFSKMSKMNLKEMLRSGGGGLNLKL